MTKYESRHVPIHVRVHGFEKKTITKIAEEHNTTVSDIFRALIIVAGSKYTADDLIYFDDGKNLVEELLRAAEQIAKNANGNFLSFLLTALILYFIIFLSKNHGQKFTKEGLFATLERQVQARFFFSLFCFLFFASRKTRFCGNFRSLFCYTFFIKKARKGEKEMKFSELGKYFQNEREGKDWSIKESAERAGMTEKELKDIEKGKLNLNEFDEIMHELGIKELEITQKDE